MTKNILIFTQNCHQGGMDTFIINLVNSWPEKGVKFCLLVNSDHPGLSRLERLTASVMTVYPYRITTPLPLSKDGNRFKALPSLIWQYLRRHFTYLQAFSQLNKLIRRFNPDSLLVINGGYPGGELCRLATIAFHLIFPSRPHLHIVHNEVQKYRPISLHIDLILDSLLALSEPVLITVSNHNALTFRRRPLINRLLTPKSVIYNGVSSSSLINRPRESFNSIPRILMLGTYEERKGHEYFFQALQLLPEHLQVKVDIFGCASTDEYNHVVSLRSRYQLETVVNLGRFVEDLSAYFLESDCLVLPSQHSESFGLVIAEAFQFGLPVVATSVGGVPEVLVDGCGGFLADRLKPSDFAAKLSLLFSSNEIYSVQSEAALRSYNSRFNPLTMCLQYEQALNSFNA